MILFVYGSLKKGKKLHYYMKDAVYLGNALSAFKYPLVLSGNGWYPYLINLKHRGFFVKGEVYKCSYSLIKKLDRLEETPYYYKRRLIEIKFKNKTLKAYTYFYAKRKKFLKKDLMEEF